LLFAGSQTPATDRRDNENFTVEMFAKGFSTDPTAFKALDELHQRMNKLRVKLLPARNKLAAHADREVVRNGIVLGAASFEWDEFWGALKDFVRILNEKTFGKPFEIDAAGVLGDADMLLKALWQSQLFEALLEGSDAVVREACLNAALSNSQAAAPAETQKYYHHYKG
jgi:hypothetical protein